MGIKPRLPPPKTGIASAEKATAQALAKSTAKNAGGLSGSVVVVASAIPVIGATIATIWVAQSTEDVLDELIAHPEVLAILGGITALVILK